MIDLAEMRERIASLEEVVYGGTLVRGWSHAGRVLGLSAPTVQERMKTDPRFPKPTRINHGKNGLRPEWNLRQLLSYKNQSK